MPAPTVPTAEPRASAPPTAAAPEPASALVPADAERMRATTGLRGRVLAADGSPVPDLAIECRVHSAAPPPAVTGTVPRLLPHLKTDAEGAFRCDDLRPRRYEVCCLDAPEVVVTVEVRAGAMAEVELRLPDTLVMVQGIPQRGVELVKGARVTVLSGKREVWEGFCGEAGFRRLLRAGRYTVRVEVSPVRGDDVYYSEHELVVPAGSANYVWPFQVGGTPCTVVVATDVSREGSPFGVDVNGVAAIGGGKGNGAEGGTVGNAVHLWLPPGAWRLHAHGPLLAAMPEREVVVGPDTPPLHVEFTTVPGASVALSLCDPRGRILVVAPELVPPLTIGGVTRPCVSRSGGARHGFDHVPLGAAELRLEDRVIDGQLLFLPFTPQGPVALQVQDGVDNAIALTVQRRAFVDVRACTATGREDGTACVAMWRGDRRVRGREERFAQRWAAWLPPGDYRVVVDRNGVEQEHPFVVAERDITLRLRP